MEYPIPTVSPPWRFRLMALTGLGVAAVALLLLTAASARTKDARSRQVMQGDLRRLEALQSSWAARRGRYAQRVAANGSDSVLAFAPSGGVELRFESRSPDDWSAIVEHPDVAVEPRRCGVYYGSPAAAPHRALVRPGTIVCW
jgi:hypothetical protein